MSGVTRKVKVWMKWTPRPNVGTVMLDDSQISSSATRVGVSIPEMGIKRGGSGWGYGENISATTTEVPNEYLCGAIQTETE